jgi:hypothetical protein
MEVLCSLESLWGLTDIIEIHANYYETTQLKLNSNLSIKYIAKATARISPIIQTVLA